MKIPDKIPAEEKKRFLERISKVLDGGQFILGKEVELFEKEAADFCGMKYAVGVNSGTDALFLSLKAMGVKQGDEVITTPFTFIASSEAIVNCGAKPVFVDINYNDFLLNVNLLEKEITEKTKAILPVHLFGQVCDMKGIMRIARQYDLKVVEDAAQAFGEKGLGKGDLLCFSFHPSKSLGGIGDGGMVLTNNKELADKLRSLRHHGAKIKGKVFEKYNNVLVGFNSRLDEIQAAVLRIKLKEFGKGGIKKLFTFRTPNRDLVADFLEKNGIDNKVYYKKPLHLQSCFKELEYEKGDFPIAEKAGKEVLTVNIYND